MTKSNLAIFQINNAFVLLIGFLVSVQALAGTCPGSDMPDTVKVVYIKYKITDEKYIKLNKKWGAPANVVGDELKELVIWGDYRWKRRYGKSWHTDEEKEQKYQQNHKRRTDDISKRQAQGVEVPMEEINRLAIEFMNHRPEKKIYEYDWIDVETPGYSLYYNRSNKKGYGVLGRRITKSDMKGLDNKARSQLDNWVSTSFKDADTAFGFEKISTKKSKILGYDVVCETTKTSFKDALRKYEQIEVCKATIEGIEIALYEKMGKSGEHYIKQSVEINTAYPVKKEQFCAPGYVEMRTP